MATSAAPPSEAASASALADPVLGSTIFARLHPTTYLSRFLRQNIRPDGRAFDEFRAVQVGSSTIGTAHGSAIVRHGGTIVVAGIKGEWLDTSGEEQHDGSAYTDGDNDEDENNDEEERETRGLTGLGPVNQRRVVVGVDLTPMSSARFKPGPPGEEAQVLVSRLMALLDAAPPLAASSLRIKSERDSALSWCLYVDLVCIAYDGNALDACMEAVSAALQDTHLPNVVALDDGTLACQSDGPGVALQLLACPLSFSFGIIHDAYLLSDPNAFESTMVAAWITITLDAASTSDDGNSSNAGAYDVVAVRCSGRCSALITSDEARRANVQGKESSGGDGAAYFDAVTEHDMVRVADEELLKVCLARAQKQCATLKQTLSRRAP